MKRRQVEFHVGDLVFLKIRLYHQTSMSKKRNEKLSPIYFEPYKVLERIDPVAYKLDPVINTYGVPRITAQKGDRRTYQSTALIASGGRPGNS